MAAAIRVPDGVAAAADVVGQRVVVEEHKATIAFTGHVGDTQGEWYGVLWDDPTRGKHNGTHEGVRYFRCEYVPPPLPPLHPLRKGLCSSWAWSNSWWCVDHKCQASL